MLRPVRVIHSVVVAAVLLTQGLNEDTAYASSFDEGHLSSTETAGISLIVGGGLLMWVGVFAGSTGGNPCADERDEQERQECVDREQHASKKFDDLRVGLVGVGLASAGIGAWLVQSTDGSGDGAALRFDGRTLSLVAGWSPDR